MRVAGRFLARRAYTETELRRKLSEAGFDEVMIDATIERLTRLDLVDDRTFANQWVEERAIRKGFGPRRLKAELEAKGVASEAIEQALAETGDEVARASELAAKRLPKLARLPLNKQGARLFAFLVGRGFDDETAEAAARAVLPPEGWD